MRRPTADELRRLKDKAAEAAAKGKLEKAADLYREVAQGDPKDVAARQKLADVLRRAGRIPDAVAAYREVADRFGKDGLLIKAIAISKIILELDPEHVETQSALAALYAQRAQGDASRPPPRTIVMHATSAAAAPPRSGPEPIPLGDASGEMQLEDLSGLPLSTGNASGPPRDRGAAAFTPPLPRDGGGAAFTPPLPRDGGGEGRGEGAPADEEPTPLEEICFAAEEAVASGVDEDLVVEIDAVEVEVTGDEPLAPEPPEPVEAGAPPPPPPPPAALPRVPIFSDLSREAFVALTRGMVLHRVRAGEEVVRERERGTSFYVVASGRLAVTRRDDGGDPVVLARLGEGDFFGEMALLSGAPRSATVAAEEDCEVLELPAEVLRAVAGRHPHLAQSLRRFYRQRLLANAMAVSPVFRPFQRGERKLLMERFRARDVAAGETIVREGAPSDGLYVVLEGAVDVVKRSAGRDVIVAQLREGDLFGEMSCLRKAAASASVVVRRAGTLLRLPRKDFDDLVVSYPQILEMVANLSEERAENLDAILSGHAMWTEDGLVLT
jgi:CRP-like cAMP-binding protein